MFQKITRRNKEVTGVMLIFSLFFLLGGFGTAAPAEIAAGLKTIVTSPAQLTCDYFALAGMGATYVNAGLVGLACIAVLLLSGFQMNHLSLMAFFLTTGFSFFGMNILNIWPCILGTWLFSRVAKTPFSAQTNFALFATALTPFVSEALCRYPVFDGMAYAMVGRIILAIILGVVCGFLLPILCKHGPNLHKGYSLYNAASVAGFIAIVLFGIMFRGTGHEIPTNTDIGESHGTVVLVFSAVMSVLMIVAGFLLNGKSFKGYKAVITATGHSCDFTNIANAPLTMVNIGIFGLFTTAYYLITGAAFTAPTAGSIICLLAIAPCGAHVLNMLPIMIGYAIASTFGAFELSTQAIIVGLCFAGAMIPVSGRFGSLCGIAAGMIHALIVTTVVTFHGGFCLYNGGFTCAVTVIFLLPILEYFFEPQDKLHLLPRRKKS